MTKKIFKSIMVVAGAVLIASLVIIVGCLYRYFSDVQGKQLEDELSFAVVAVEKEGRNYLEELQSKEYRLTWVAENGTVIYDTQSDGENMENHADREEIQEALRNKEGKSLRYSTTLLEKHFTVQDGLMMARYARIFERFYRVDKSRSKESGGTGLGISIVKHAVQYLNGKIDLQSSPGQGTVIQVIFH